MYWFIRLELLEVWNTIFSHLSFTACFREWLVVCSDMRLIPTVPGSLKPTVVVT